MQNSDEPARSITPRTNVAPVRSAKAARAVSSGPSRSTCVVVVAREGLSTLRHAVVACPHEVIRSEC